MARSPVAAALLLCLLLPAAAADAQARHAPRALILKLRETATPQPGARALFPQRARTSAAARRLARATPPPPDLGSIYTLQLAPGVDPETAAAQARANPDVLWAQPDLLLRPDGFVADDPYLFSFGSWGQPYADLWGLDRIRARDAWAYTRGEGAVVAVVDSGLDYAHPDMAGNVWVNPGEDLDGDGIATDADRNGADDDANGFVDDLIGWDFLNRDADPYDDGGHGTHVAGTAAAVGGNGIGISGVAPLAKVMALKGFPPEGEGLSTVLARAIVYAADNGADVINTSWSCSGRCPANPLIDEAVIYAHAQGTVVVDSAGNSGDDVVFYSPEKLRQTIVVASSNENDSHSAFSSIGFLLDVTAPGAGRHRIQDPFSTRAILSLLSAGAPPLFSEGLRVGTGFMRDSGTSMSTPHVAGVVALVRSLHPDMTPEEIRALLRATARDVGRPGHDRLFGAGIVDALAAVTGVAPAVRGEIASPGPGENLDARPGVVAVRGSADGADFAGYALAFGRGVDPAVWEPVTTASAGPVTAGLLAEWPVAELPPGSYVLRLAVTSARGETLHEFAPISLERTQPFPISSEGPAAFAPDVAGELVVWESARSDDPLPGARDVLATDLRSGAELALAAGPGDQHGARIAGRRAVWIEQLAPPEAEVRSCRIDTRRGQCDAETLSPGPALRSNPVVAGARVFWLEPGGIQLCDLGAQKGPHPCTPERVAPRPSPQFELEVSGNRLVWTESQPLFAVWSCLLHPRSGACPLQLVDQDTPSQFTPAVSGRLFAWEQFGVEVGRETGSQVQVCRLDPRSGACPALAVGDPSIPAPAPDVDGEIVVWSAAPPGEGASIYYCEHDAVANACPAQRITGHPAGQQHPAVAGHLVAFEDLREGASRIYGVELPQLLVHGARRVREGSRLQLAIEGLPAREPLSFAAELADGAPIESLGMRLAPHGNDPSRALLSWRPPAGSAGRYEVLLRGTTTNGGLVTRERIAIEVERAWRGR